MKSYAKKLNSNPDFYYIPLPKRSKEVFLEINLRTGNAQENDKDLGLGHLLEHYLIGSFSKDKKSKLMEYGGAIYKEQTNYWLKSSKKKILEDSRYFLDAILNPEFSNKKVFISEKEAALNELSSKINSLDEKGDIIMLKERFSGNCQYTRTKIEEYKNIKNKNLKDVKNYYNKYFFKSNVLITLGAYNLDDKTIKEIRGTIRKYSLPSAKIKLKDCSCKSSSFKISLIKNNIIKKDLALLLTFAYLGAEELKPWERMTRNAICDMLSGSKIGIFDELREVGIYKLNDDNIVWKNNGIIIFATILPKKKIKIFLNIFIKKLKEIKSGLISRKNLRKILSDYKRTAKNSFNNNEKRLEWITYDILTYNKIMPLEEDIKNIKKININYIKNLANKLFVKEKLNLLLIGDNIKNINKKEVKKLLKF